jgi:hypothetical protein
MVLNTDATFKKINELYNKTGFLDKYGADIWLAVIITLIFFCITAYYYVLNNLEPIKADWSNQKCSPLVLPFAGLINKGPNDTTLDFTSKNFTGCVQTILTHIIGVAFQPVYYIMKTLTNSFADMLTSVNTIRAMFDRVRTTIKTFSAETMGRTLNITLPIIQMLIGIKSMGAKMTGVLTGSLFTLFGSYLTLQSLFLFIIELITIILIALVAIIIVFLIISAIPLFGSWAIPVAAVNIAIMILILIPTIIIQIFMSNVLDLSTRGVPDVPRCFAGETAITVAACNRGEDIVYSEKTLATVEVGDVLKNGEVVTAVMKFSASGQRLYNLAGVQVTGEHRVCHPTRGWLKVKYHPDSVLLPHFTEPFVYCLGTTTKTFTLGQHVYSDWDDIDEAVVKCLQAKCPAYKGVKSIHRDLDNGFVAGSLVALCKGASVAIEDVQVHDFLADGEEVLGVIKISASDLPGLYEYKIQGTSLYGYNISMNPTLCLAETFPLKTQRRENYLYQLLTDTGTFKINGIKVHDYNYGIDKYL